ncbi:unnamed protein product [Schistosoma mattheei]|uniref:Uncharacterized protein n=1 Tax=Schistosoma mattheei TaxID=31246 RepID=A0A3P8ERE2_9TREM|nr:unnamed protein product [Schistosoma mattheei]
MSRDRCFHLLFDYYMTLSVHLWVEIIYDPAGVYSHVVANDAAKDRNVVHFLMHGR